MRRFRRLDSLFKFQGFHSIQPPAAFQVFSDLHLEVGQQYSSWDFPIKAPYLILAGDIGRLADYDVFLSFLERQTNRFQSVFLVLGNHEFYGSSFAEGIVRAQRLVSEPRLQEKLVLLHRRRFDVPDSDVTILGCSLWSHITDSARELVSAKVNDFRRISEWTTSSHNAEHTNDLKWLREQVKMIQQEESRAAKENRQSQSKRKILIVTHHAPSIKGTSEPRFEGSEINTAFATDLLERKEDWKDVVAWVYGHTHYSTEFQKVGVRVLSNQRGYVLPGAEMRAPEGYGKGKWKKFDETFVLNV